MHTAVQPGQVLLGKYCVEHVLGEGGMGVVVAARHLDLGQLFAIKLLLPAALTDADAVARFLREARAAARLKSEHVARVQDVGRLENGAPYMVMEHLSGNDLQREVRQRGPLPSQEATTYVYQACEAVAEAHSLGIVHRDLKPANLFLTKRLNGTPSVKVLDFGISKDLDPSQKVGDLTKTGVVIGSPSYMSPEQLANMKETDARGDIWSLGVILFQLLTGKLPFTADTLTEVITKIVMMPAPPLAPLCPDLPPGLEEVVLKCLEKHREQRFQSVRDLMDALQPFVTGDWVKTSMRMDAWTEPKGLADLGVQTSNVWAGAAATEKPRRSLRPVAGLALAVGIPLLVGAGAWLALGRGSGGNSTAAVESVAPVAAPVAPTVTPAPVDAPAKTARGMDSPAPVAEPTVPATAPSSSASVSTKLEPVVTKPKTPRPGGTTPTPQRAKSAAPKPPSTSKVAGFNE